MDDATRHRALGSDSIPATRLTAGAKAWLSMQTRLGDERRFPLEEGRTVVGRHTRCDLRVSLPILGDEHCELIFENGQLTLRDLGAASGTHVNGRPVRGEAILKDGDRVTLGPAEFRARVDLEVNGGRSPIEVKPAALDLAVDTDAAQRLLRPHAERRLNRNGHT